MTFSQKNIFKNFSYLLIEKIAVLSINVLLVLILPAHLTYLEFGEFITAFSIVSLCWIFLELGFNTKLIKEIAADRTSTNFYISQISFLKLITSLLIITFAIILLQFSSYSENLIRCTYILLISAFVMNLTETFQSAFKGFEKMNYSTSILTFANLIIFIGCLLIIEKENVIINIAFVFLIGRIVNLLLSFIIFSGYYKSFRFNIKIKNSISIMFDSLTRIPAQLFLSNFYNQGIVIVSVLSKQDVGSFGLAAKILTSLIFILTSFFEAVLPIMSKFSSLSKKTTKNIFLHSLKILIIIIVIVILLTIGFSKIIIRYIFGPEYLDSYYFLKILIIAFPFMVLISLFQYFLASINQQKKLFFYLIGAFCANFIFSLTGYEIFGINGVMGAISLTSIVSFIIIYYSFYRKIVI